MCVKPLVLKDRTVACGHCIECLIARSDEWAFRLEHEGREAKTGMFLTLTYSPEHVPITANDDGEVVTTLVKKDFQDFMKRLRKASDKVQKGVKLRFFACGEYGSKTDRAHYHAIIYNVPKKVFPDIVDIWGKGHVKVGNVEPKSIRYVTNYMMMKDHKIQPGMAKPFTLMSRNPGIGQRYVYMNAKTHRRTFDFKRIEGTSRPKPLPRYLQEKIYDPEGLKCVKDKKAEYYEPYIQEQLKKAYEESPLDPGEYIRKQKQDKLKLLSNRKKYRPL